MRIPVILLSLLLGLPGTDEARAALRLVKRVAVTSDAEGGSARPEIAAVPDRVFVIYLGDIGSPQDKAFKVKVFDSGLDAVIATRTLVTTTAEHGGPTDIRIASEGADLYAFYETFRPTSGTSGETSLWGARYTLDDALTQVASTREPIAISHPMAELPEGGELLDDPAPLVTPDAVYVVTRIKSPIAQAGRTIYRVRAFAKKDLAKLSEADLDLSAVADGRARVASLLWSEGRILMALATTASGSVVSEGNDDGAPSDIVLVALRTDWTLDPAFSPRLLTSEPDDRENYVSGLESNGRCLFMSYKQAVGIPPTGEQRAHLKVFSPDLTLLFDEITERTPWGPSGGSIRPSLDVLGTRVLFGQSGGQVGTGNAEVLVWELESGCSSECTLTCSASATPDTGGAPLQSRFTSQVVATSCLASPATLWDLGDGSTSTEPNPTHTYAAPGTYSWTLTVSADGKTCTRSGTVDALAPPAGGSSTLVVPIVLFSHGAGDAHYVSEMTLTNRGSADATITFSYTPSFGGGGGLATDILAARRQKIVPDALAYLRTLNGAIAPESGDRGGTLRVSVSGVVTEDDVSIAVRTRSPSGGGSASVAYRAIPVSKALTGTSYLCGLRQNGRDRSNVAVLNAGADASGPITVRMTVISGDPAAPKAQALPDVTLSPGGFTQYSGILATAGVANGMVRVERIAGNAPYYAYGVINDQATSDGSFVPPAASADLSRVARLTVPVIVETASYESELILANFSETPRSLRFTYVADAVAGGSTTFSLDIGPSEQKIIPDLVQYLRSSGTPGIGPAESDFVGALLASVASGDAAGLFLGARTSTRPSGSYGVFSGAVPFGKAAVDEAWLYGLQQTAESRTNLALVNTGELGDATDALRIELFDGETGAKVATVEGGATTLAARGFTQLGSILAVHAPGTSNGYARITRTSGSNPFIAYSVVNDGARPGERTGDGAFVEMDVVGTDPFPQAFGVFAAFAPEFGPFWTSLGLDYAGYETWAGARMRELGATWTRSNLQLVWDLVEPVKGGGFDWTASRGGEQVFAGAAANGVQYLGVFHEGSGPIGRPGQPELRNPLADLSAYERFVQAAVERYDGDGIDDAPGGIVIKHWQVGNETGIWTGSGRTNADYVRWFEATTAAIHRADPEARVALIASTDGSSLDPLHAEVIKTLAADGVRFDVVDLHHWKTADLASSRMEAVPAYRNLFSNVGVGGVELWSCEHGTYVGTPVEMPGQCSPACQSSQVCSPFKTCVPRCTNDASCPAALPRCDTSTGLCTQRTPDQSRADQARSLLYRYVVNRALGVKRILWNNLAAWRCFGGGCGSFYDRLGLVADGYGPGETMADAGKPRPAFHSYRMLAARTDAPFAESLGEVDTGDAALHVYAYRNRSSGKPGLVAWADTAKTAVLAFAASRAEVTGLVTDDLGVPLRSQVFATSGGRLSVALDPDPIWIAEPAE